MSILQEIARYKIKEVSEKRTLRSIDDLQIDPLFLKDRKRILESNINDSSLSIIAEFKRKSPSVSSINLDISVEDVITEYDQHGALAMSVLTDQNYFGGSNADLMLAGKFTEKPLLRKDFIVDEYQIYEAKEIGASMILLISAILTKEQVLAFAVKAKELNLDVLLEVHDKDEIKTYNEYVTAIGVNNRNLKTFKVDYNQSKDLFNYLPQDVLKISESGLKKVEHVAELKQLGYDAFLIGERFMKSKSPGKEFKQFKDAVVELI